MARHYAVMPGCFPLFLIRALRREARLRDARGEFRQAGIGRRQAHQRDERIRNDRTLWLDGASQAQSRLLGELEQLRLAVNRELFLGLFDLEAHFAIYDPGAYYRRHLDAFRGDNGRLLSVVLYLNEGWAPDLGGQLRLWSAPRGRQVVAEVAPVAGTLVCFLSDHIPHEVLEVHAQRISIAGWFRCNNTTADWLDPPR